MAKDTTYPDTPMGRAVAIAGSYREAAEALNRAQGDRQPGCDASEVHKWAHGKRPVPAVWAVAMEKAFGDKCRASEYHDWMGGLYLAPKPPKKRPTKPLRERATA